MEDEKNVCVIPKIYDTTDGNKHLQFTAEGCKCSGNASLTRKKDTVRVQREGIQDFIITPPLECSSQANRETVHFGKHAPDQKPQETIEYLAS